MQGCVAHLAFQARFTLHQEYRSIVPFTTFICIRRAVVLSYQSQQPSQPCPVQCHPAGSCKSATPGSLGSSGSSNNRIISWRTCCEVEHKAQSNGFIMMMSLQSLRQHRDCQSAHERSYTIHHNAVDTFLSLNHTLRVSLIFTVLNDRQPIKPIYSTPSYRPNKTTQLTKLQIQTFNLVCHIIL